MDAMVRNDPSKITTMAAKTGLPAVAIEALGTVRDCYTMFAGPEALPLALTALIHAFSIGASLSVPRKDGEKVWRSCISCGTSFFGSVSAQKHADSHRTTMEVLAGTPGIVKRCYTCKQRHDGTILSRKRVPAAVGPTPLTAGEQSAAETAVANRGGVSSLVKVLKAEPSEVSAAFDAGDSAPLHGPSTTREQSAAAALEVAPTVPTAAPMEPAIPPPATLGVPSPQRRSRPPIPPSHAPKVTVVRDAASEEAAAQSSEAAAGTAALQAKIAQVASERLQLEKQSNSDRQNAAAEINRLQRRAEADARQTMLLAADAAALEAALAQAAAERLQLEQQAVGERQAAAAEIERLRTEQQVVIEALEAQNQHLRQRLSEPAFLLDQDEVELQDRLQQRSRLQELVAAKPLSSSQRVTLDLLVSEVGATCEAMLVDLADMLRTGGDLRRDLLPVIFLGGIGDGSIQIWLFTSPSRLRHPG